jgi:hypothetical protein
MNNNAFTSELAAASQTPVFPKTLHRLRPNPDAAATKSQKRDNIFSKSRDTKENRGTREMKDEHIPQTLFRISALL